MTRPDFKAMADALAKEHEECSWNNALLVAALQSAYELGAAHAIEAVAAMRPDGGHGCIPPDEAVEAIRDATAPKS